MFGGLLLGGTIAKLVYDTNKSLTMDEKALSKFGKAFEREAEARYLIQMKEEQTDKRLMNVVKKKKSIINSSIPKFIEVYDSIQKVVLENDSNNVDITRLNSDYKKINKFSTALSVKSQLTDKELICTWLFKGLGSTFVKDSERYMSAANSQMSFARTAYSQAESIAEVYDAIVARADRIANLLASMNALFIKSISETKGIIEKNGINVKNYSENDKATLMTCVNIAAAMCDIVNVPVLEDNGEICKAAEDMISTGEEYLNKMSDLLLS